MYSFGVQCRRGRTGQVEWLKSLSVFLFGAGAFYGTLNVEAQVSVHKPRKTIDYNRDVRPIISKCFTCHGHDPKQLQAGLRLDIRSHAIATLEGGRAAIVPFHPERSELIDRIFSDSKYLVMPPKSSNKILSAEEKAVLRQWILEGAEYKEHWAFVPPVRPSEPEVKNIGWIRNPIDRFVLARIEQKGWRPEKEADRRTLIRRASLDIIGLPPTAREVNQFLADKQSGAYERVIDRLLASPQYGERMAMDWLDYARYADSNGYQADYERFQWRWRDWVIEAFNRNMPYDQFTVEQLAGDLLPNARQDQILATGFNRNHRINTEGGVVPEEWRVEGVIDRVETTAQTWLGLTAGCARCHDHKYDPLSQKEFYSLFSYFNNVPESGTGEERPVNHPPLMKAPTHEQQVRLAAYDQRIAPMLREVRKRLLAIRPESEKWQPSSSDGPQAPTGAVAHYSFSASPYALEGNVPAPVKRGNPLFEIGTATGAVTTGGEAYLDLGNVGDFDTHQPFSYGAWIRPKDGNGSAFSRMDSSNDFRGYDLFMSGGQVSVHILSKWPEDALKITTNDKIPNDKWTHVLVTYDGSGKAAGTKIYINGIPAATSTEQDSLKGSIRTGVTARVGRRTDSSPFSGAIDDLVIYERNLSPEEVGRLGQANALVALTRIPSAKRTDAQKDAVSRAYLSSKDPSFRVLDRRLATLVTERDTLDGSISTVMVMKEMASPRPAYVLVRGQYDHHGPSVSAAIPTFLQIKGKRFAPNRLGLAKWIVDPSNPLTARVTMNRLWARFFGNGIVDTVEDFGTRADFPSHPELLDWLATEFTGHHWNLKQMVREIVTSATYRQSSSADPKKWTADPSNKWLARGPRFRLPAEVLRDQAMYAGGLLTQKVGGPSVRPYQPEGVWDETNVYGNLRNYKHDMGSDLHRRSLYTIWKRTAAPPNMTLFDMPSRETCRVQRARTDTPLQALALLNDITYVEAAKGLANRMLTEGGDTEDSRIRFGFGTVLARDPSTVEVNVLKNRLGKLVEHFHKNPQAAAKLARTGAISSAGKLGDAEFASYILAASTILNLDETLNKD
jgi:Protein of unknown function (DUF1553)/Protein of unknown function (DUF1549)/Concanavalin A-like lectin/glucanases superfamily/Planctomycete cytochrome C